jgi:hypothetical protein
MLAANLDLQQRSGPYYFDNNGICILAAQPHNLTLFNICAPALQKTYVLQGVDLIFTFLKHFSFQRMVL